MKNDTFKFFVYRLNKKVRDDVLFDDKKLDRSDKGLRAFFDRASTEIFDADQISLKSEFKWSIRDHVEISERYSGFYIARSKIRQDGLIVTGNSIKPGTSESLPPPADVMVVIFDWKRHIAVIENRSGMVTGETWLKYYNKIVKNAAIQMDYMIIPLLEPIPVKGSIMHHLERMDSVTRFKVWLKVPNPEISPFAKNLYDEMKENGIEEYLQEFHNPAGLKKATGSRIHQTAAMAESGYKSGPAQIDGVINGKKITIDEGKSAVKGKVDKIKGIIQGLKINAKSKELTSALQVLEQEINELAPTDR